MLLILLVLLAALPAGAQTTLTRGTAFPSIQLDASGAFGTGTGISFGDGNTEIFENADNVLRFHTAGQLALEIDADKDIMIFDRIIGGSGGAAFAINSVIPTVDVPTFLPNGNGDGTAGIGWAGTGILSLIGDGGSGAEGILQIGNGKSVFSRIVQFQNNATEPADCVSAIYGAVYFDTTDKKLCVCINDGTDDEWVPSDDYTHGGGHCSIS